MYEWKSSKSIEEHINKHILDLEGCKEAKQEKQFWEKEFEPDYDFLIKATNSGKKGTDLYEKYKQSSEDNINKAEFPYIFKTNKGKYSINYTNYDNNNLTTGLQLMYKNGDPKEPKICTCYFKRNSIILDSTIFYTVKYILTHDIDKSDETPLLTIEGLKVFSENYKKSMCYAIYVCRDFGIDLVRNLLWKYLELQLEIKNRSKEEWQEHLINKLKTGKSDKCMHNREKTIADLKNRLNELTQLEKKFKQENNDIGYEKAFIELGILTLDESYIPEQSIIELMKKKGIFEVV